MITILDATPARGYTGWDHLLDDADCRAVVGQSFRSVRQALAAANREHERHCDSRVRLAPVRIEVRFASGKVGSFV